MDIGSIWAALRIDTSKVKGDVTKAADDAGVTAGKTLGQKWKEGFSKEKVGQGLIQGLGIGAGLTAFSAISAGVGAVASAIGDSVDAAKDFDAQLRTINTVAGVSDDQLHRIGDSIQALSRETGQTTEDLTAGFYDLVSAGIPAADAMDVLKNSATLAVGALGTTAETVDLMTTALNAFGIDASDSARVMDIFAAAVRDGKVTASELGQSLATVAPIAAAAGIEIEEVAAGYAQLTKNGVPATEAATQMRAAIAALLTPNLALAKIQKEVNINFAELARSDGLAVALDQLRTAAGSDEAFANALGRVEAFSGALLVTGENAGATAKELTAIKTAADKGGTAMGQFAEQAKSAAFHQKQLDANVQTLQQDIGELLLPVYDGLVGVVGLVIQAFRDLGGAFHDLQRFINQDLAHTEDLNRSLIILASTYGLPTDAVLAYAAALKESQQAQADSKALFNDLRDRLVASGLDYDTATDKAGELAHSILALSKASGLTLSDAMNQVRVSMQTMSPALENITAEAGQTSTFLTFMARELGVVTDAAGEFVPQMSEAEAIIGAFLLQQKGIAAFAGTWHAATSSIAEDTEEAGRVIAAATEDIPVDWRAAMNESVRVIKQAARDQVEAIRVGIVDMADTIKTGKQRVIDEQNDLAFQMKHPWKEERYADYLRDKIKMGLRKMHEADKEGMPGVAAQWAQFVQNRKDELDSLPSVAAESQRKTIAALAIVKEQIARTASTLAGFFNPFSDFPGHAMGGPASGLTWVGETGKELVWTPPGSYVFPHEQSMSMAASGATSGGDRRIYLTIDGRDHDITDVIYGASESAYIGRLRPAGI